MATFKIPGSASPKPDSPAVLFRDLKRDPSIKFLYDHQGTCLSQYYSRHLNTPNIAIELPTGAGKTLVAMMIAEYRRRAFGERVAFLCPTRQLAAQVHGQSQRYGVKASLLVGRQDLYDEAAFYDYQQAKAIAVTTYSGLFNIRPRIDDPELLICDDAHAAEGYIADHWTVHVGRNEHKEVFEALFRCIKTVHPAIA
jgi:replicative superfamily II helicase